MRIVLTAALYSEGKAESLHTVWVAALALAILFSVAAAVEFFLLDIRQVFAVESGMAARKRIRQINGGVPGSRGGQIAGHVETVTEPTGKMVRQVKRFEMTAEQVGKISEPADNRGQMSEETEYFRTRPMDSGMMFVIERDIVVIHTDERIGG